MSFFDLSQFYKNFAELYSAGIDAITTIETLKKTEKRIDKVHSMNLVIHNLKSGRSLFQSFKATSFVPVFDLPVVKAAEDSGRIVEVFKMIAQKHLDTYAAVKKIKSSLFKPYATLAVALMFPGVSDLYANKISVAVYLRNSLGILFMITFIFYLIYDYWIQSFFNLKKARHFYHIFSSLPFLSKLSNQMAIQKFSSGLALMLESSIDFFEALKQSGLCSSNPKIQEAVERIIQKIKSGDDLQTAFQQERVFPSDLITALSLGSQSGKLPEFLNRYSLSLKNQIENSIQTIVKIIPMALYWMVLGFIIYAVVKFYSQYLDQLLQIAQ